MKKHGAVSLLVWTAIFIFGGCETEEIPAEESNERDLTPFFCSRETPVQGVSRAAKLVLDAPNQVLLWGEGVTLYWRFEDGFFRYADDPTAAEEDMREYISSAIEDWGEASPLQFEESEDDWDFEFTSSAELACDEDGACVVATAFFPNYFYRYPSTRKITFFTKAIFEELSLSDATIVHVIVHELGHVFGLRHFFAPEEESHSSSVIYGEHVPQTVMNYGEDSVLTQTDKDDLKSLYEGAWNGTITEIEGIAVALLTREQFDPEVSAPEPDPSDPVLDPSDPVLDPSDPDSPELDPSPESYDPSLLADGCIDLRSEGGSHYLWNYCGFHVNVSYCLGDETSSLCATQWQRTLLLPHAAYCLDVGAYEVVRYLACFDPGQPEYDQGAPSCVVGSSAQSGSSF